LSDRSLMPRALSRVLPVLLTLMFAGAGTAEVPDRIEGPESGHAPHAGSTTHWTAPASVDGTVKQMIADYFGIPAEQLEEDTDLIENLNANPMDAFEILAMICQSFDVDLPNWLPMTRIGTIIDYVKSRLDRSTGSDDGEVRSTATSDTSGNDKEREVYIQEIFYATNRKPDPVLHYSGFRADTTPPITYGRCDVSIPVLVHRKGHIERPSLLRLEWDEDPKRHMVIQKVAPLSWIDFKNGLATSLDSRSNGTTREAFVFIHGFNVTFDKAARRTAQMAYDLEFPGAPILFSWPSDGSLFQYLSDREDVEWSAPHLEGFLRALTEEMRIERIHLIAHSMGNQALIRAIHRMALRDGKRDKPLFENVILAAPDFDAQVFTDQIAPEAVSYAKRWTLYASDKDHALDASTVLSVKRLGLPLSTAAGVDTIDASGIDVTPWSVPEFHAYHVTKQRVIRDLVSVMKGMPPEERSLIRRLKGELPYWALPKMR
jgi:esterase/lipase superfamily enzyme/acyl carrier protein